jgi:hypothetical protein
MAEKWKSYLDMFSRTALRLDGKAALVYGDRSVSYGDLAKASDVIAEALLSCSVTRGQIVPIVLPRCIEAFAGMLGVWKAGAAVSFINTAYPAERIQDIRRQCGGGFFIDEDWIKKLDPFAHAAPVNFQSSKPEREDLAMVVFTFCDAFQQVLGIAGIGVLDNYILLGGDSISAAKLVFLLYKSTGISVVDILLQQTPRALAATLSTKSKDQITSYAYDFESQEASNSSRIELTSYQTIFYNEWLLNPDRYDYNIVEDRILEGKYILKGLIFQ